MSLSAARSFFDSVNHAYVAVHQAKEDLFWSTYMAISSDDAAFARAEQAYKNFIADPDRLRETRHHLHTLMDMPNSDERDALVHGLRGWLALFEAHVVDDVEGRRLMHELVEAEAALFTKRRTFSPRHVNERGEEEDATLSMLATNLTSNPDERRRRTSYDGLRAIEAWVLDHGFLELVSLRNRLARALGARDFFELKLRRNA